MKKLFRRLIMFLSPAPWLEYQGETKGWSYRVRLHEDGRLFVQRGGIGEWVNPSRLDSMDRTFLRCCRWTPLLPPEIQGVLWG